MVHFVLNALASEVTLDLSAAIPADSALSIDASAIAIQYISLDDIKAIFKYQTDSNDTIDVDTSDLKYYVDYDTFENLALNPANAVLSENEIASADSTGQFADNKKMVAHDFLRYLAEDLFGTHYGVDIFTNEKSVIQSIRSVCGDTEGNTLYNINAAVKKVSTSSEEADLTGLEGTTGSKYMTNASDDDLNLCRTLMRQMISAAPSRFADIDATLIDGERPLPFQTGDIIAYKLTVNAAENQHLITRDTDPVGHRSYEIRWVINESGENTAVASDEL